MDLLTQIDKNGLNFCPYNKIVATLVYLNKTNKETIEREIKKLIFEGKLVNTSKNKFATSKKAGFLEGKISATKAGYAFFVPNDKSLDDLFISKENLNGAMHDDTVVVKKIQNNFDKKSSEECEVVKILSHGMNQVVGKVTDVTQNFAFVKVNNKKVKDIFVKKQNLMGAKLNDTVVVELTKRDNLKPEGKVKEIIKTSNPISDDVLSIIREYELYEEFPDYVLNSAKNVQKKLTEKDYENRVDLRELNTFTIDGEDAKDLDDAISLSINPNKTFHLGVHIADVGHYVKRESILDAEAYKRGTSTYFPNAVFPMLPKELSNGICSLNEGEDRLTLSVFMDIDRLGNVLNSEICESVIKSKARMTYTNVAKILDGDVELCKKYNFLIDDLIKMEVLAKILEKMRKNRGSLDFDIPEPKIILNEKTLEIERFEKRPVTIADRIIESFMLIANETVAKTFFYNHIPFVYRVHEKPTSDKLNMFVSFVTSLGLKFDGDTSNITNKDIQNFIEKTKNLKYKDVVNSAMLRSMQKAKYSPICSGHFGLGAHYYCHFTSPIRRYPDLTIHRIIKENLHGKLDKQQLRSLKPFVEESAEQSSIREVISEKAERDVDDYFKAYYLSKKIGEQFKGIISGVTENGIYVQLENTCEGFVPVECLPDKHYDFVEKNYTLLGSSTKYQLGEKVDIVVENVNPQARRVDFSLVGCPKKRECYEKKRNTESTF